MKIGSKLSLQVSVFVFIATTALLLIVNIQLKKYAITLAEEKAALLLSERQATIQYVSKTLRPPLFEFFKEHKIPSSYFEPSWMSAAFMNRKIMKEMNNTDFPNMYYKNAAINARVHTNEADYIEREFLEYVKQEQQFVTKSGVFDFDGQPFFIFMKTSTSVFIESCMKCHSTPDKTPKGVIKLYGSERGFGKKVGDIASVLSLRIPLEKIYTRIDSITKNLFLIICLFSGVFFLLQWLISRRVLISPLKKVTEKALAIAKDDTFLGERILLENHGELSELAEAFSDMSEKLASNRDNLENRVSQRTNELEQKIEEHKKAERQIQELVHQLEIERDLAQRNSLTDSLTGLFNRRFFDNALRTEFSRHKRSGSQLSLIMLDVDHFKKYNDYYGHLEGDDCLKKIAHTLKTMVERAPDIVARYGGEEFVVILPDTNRQGAAVLAGRICESVLGLALPHVESDTSEFVTISLGIASSSDHVLTDGTQLVALADQALYQAKMNGRNRYEILVTQG